ncbi:intradiol ring-cleavage dioxygenase [Piscinibacter sakaiensis]|uniref:dioxygenase family protein n=1 Tax=Piscinibacter sakaiensis TaxID=1547922 RepID=UPI003AAF103E
MHDDSARSNQPLAQRRRLITGLATGVAGMAVPGWLAAAGLPSMTAGPFYPSPEYRARQLDWDADLTRVGTGPGRAAGEWLDLVGTVVDRQGRIIDRAEIEIWQCDVHGSYRHPRGAGARVDEAFQGFGSSVADAQGRYRFRTIKPAPYPGRTPHIHVRLRHPSFGEFTSQLFVDGEPANAGDFLFRQMSADEREAAMLRLARAPADAGVKWLAERPLVVPV